MKEVEEIRLPEGWRRVTIDEVVEVIRGISFPKDSKRFAAEEGYVACLRTANVQQKVEWDDLWFVPEEFLKNEDKLIFESDILISTANSLELLGKVALVKELPYRSTLGAFISAIRPRHPINAKCIYYLLCSELFKSEVRKRASTTTNISNISTGKLKQITIPLPPLAEQHRIVAKIEELFSELDNGVAQLRQVQAQLKSYRQSVLKHAFEGKLTEGWRQQHKQLPNAQELLTAIQQERQSRHQQALKDWQQSVIQWTEAGKPGGTPLGKKPTKPKAPKELPPLTEEEIAKLPALPEGWGWTEMKAIVLEACLGKMLDKKKNKGELMPYLRNINVRWFSFETDDLLEMRFEQSEHDRYSVEKGDLVICEGGEPGRAAIWDGRIANMKIQKALHRVRFFNHLIHNKFVLYYLLYSASTDHLAKFFTGTTIKHLTGKGLSDLTIPLCSTEEQHQIVQEIESRLSVAEHLEKTVEDSLRQAEVLRQSILQRAFTGQLVPQDPNDEPAAELLKRIQTEKSTKPKQKGGAKTSDQSADEQLSITF